ncbi:MAG: polysaccharide biosynthesis C-terminal domain-containing protein [Saprospiraceae bacterium]
MKREFLLNILLLVFINLLIKPIFIFGIDLGVQNRVGEHYGTYFALLNLAYLFQILNDFGIQSFNNRHISQHPQLLPKYFPNLLAIKWLLAAVYVALTMAVAAFALGYGAEVLPLLFILLLNQVLVQLILFLRSNISGLGHYRLDSLLSSLDKLLMVATCGVLLWTDWLPFSLLNFALAQTLALFVTAIVVFILLRQRAVFPVRPSWAANWRAGRPAVFSMFRQSLPYALVVLLMFAYTRLDAVLLERMAGAAHADVYASAFRLLEACNMFGYLFASLLLPMFARLLKEKGDVRPLTSMSFKLIWAGSVTLAAAIFFAREDLLRLMMPARANEYRFEVLGVLIWAFVPVSVTYIFSTLLTARERMMRMNRFFIVGIALDVLLNLALIPHWQAVGSAVAALATQVFIAGAMVWISVQEFGFRPSRRGLVQVIGFFTFILVFDWFLFEKTDFAWQAKFVSALCAGMVGLFLFRMVGINSWKMLGTPRSLFF